MTQNVAVKVGQQHNRFVIVLKKYPHPARVDANLIQAIIDALDERYQGAGWKEFDYVEILKYVDLNES